MFIPPGVAHGFAALTDLTLTYLVDNYYNPEDELGVAWDDPEIGADWGVADPVLSDRDRGTRRGRASPPAAGPSPGCGPPGSQAGRSGRALRRGGPPPGP